jgi:hypothetical protein
LTVGREKEGEGREKEGEGGRRREKEGEDEGRKGKNIDLPPLLDLLLPFHSL